MRVGVHQGSVLSPLLFIIVLEALSKEFRTGCPWELLYADDLMISARSKEELLLKVESWKSGMEKKGLRVNMAKTKVMVFGMNLDVLMKSGKHVFKWSLAEFLLYMVKTFTSLLLHNQKAYDFEIWHEASENGALHNLYKL